MRPGMAVATDDDGGGGGGGDDDDDDDDGCGAAEEAGGCNLAYTWGSDAGISAKHLRQCERSDCPGHDDALQASSTLHASLTHAATIPKAPLV